MKRRSMFLGAVITMACGGRCAAQCDSYAVEIFNGPFCQFSGFTGATPQAINDNGVIVGFFRNCSDDERAFRWSNGPSITSLPTTSGLYSARAYDVNSLNQTAGQRELATGPIVGIRGFLYENSVYTDLGIIPGTFIVEALAINDRTDVVGTSGTKPFLWRNGQMNQIRGLPIGPSATPHDINNHGQVVGWMGVAPFANFMAEAFLWQDGVGVSLGIPRGGYNSEARAISDTGHVAGHYFIEISPGVKRRHGFHWRDGVFTDLGLLAPFDTINVRGVNDRGEIVGWCEDSNQKVQSRPFIWRDGVMTDLNALADLPPITVIDKAWDINNQGQIAADGRILEAEAISMGLRLTPRSKVQGDYDCNHVVNVDDLLGVINHWGPSNGPADFNLDQVVDPADLMAVINGWTFE